MDLDYPASHSMDTSWFAVDADGHVGLFHSGEAGAVPRRATTESYQSSLIARLREVVPAGAVLYDPLGRTQPGPRGHPLRAWIANYPILLFLSSLEPVRDLLAAQRAIEVAATQGKAVVLPRVSEEELERLHKLPECRGSCIISFDPEEPVPASEAQLGLFRYGHLTENWISGPYGREVVPAVPLHVDQLPPDLRQRLGELRLDRVRFTEAPYIQPVEHVECESWGSGYLDAGCERIRPIPGKVAEEYKGHFEDYYAGSGYPAEPPPESE
jgi:hypothetical protein